MNGRDRLKNEIDDCNYVNDIHHLSSDHDLLHDYDRVHESSYLVGFIYYKLSYNGPVRQYISQPDLNIT